MTDNLQLTLQIDNDVFKIGQPVAIKLTLLNTGDTDRAINFRSGQQYDIIVQQHGHGVWRWSNGRMFTIALRSITISPKESRSYDIIWQQNDNNGAQVPPGDYQITGKIPFSNPSGPETDPITVAIKAE